MKLGALLLLLSIGWVVTVFLWDVMGPAARVGFGLILGSGIFLFGAFKIGKYPSQASVLLALGAGVIDVTIYAAQVQYRMFSPTVSLILLSVVVVSLAYVSVSNRNQSLAFLGLFLGGLAPFLTGSVSSSVAELFSYVFVLCAGTLWITRLTGWRNLSLAGMALYAFFAVPAMHASPQDEAVKLMVAVLFAVLFFMVNILSIIHDRKAEPVDLFSALLNGFLLLGWVSGVVPSELQSLACMLAAIAASMGAYLVYSQTGLKQPVYIHSIVAAVFLGVATAYQFDGSVLIMVYALEVFGIVSGVRLIFDKASSAAKASITSVVPGILSLSSLGMYLSRADILNEHFFTIIVVMAMFIGLSFLIRSSDSGEQEVSLSKTYRIIALLYACFLLIVIPQHAFPDDVSALVITYAMEAAVLTGIARVFISSSAAVIASVWIFLPGALSIGSIGFYIAGKDVFNKHLLAMVLVMAMLLLFWKIIEWSETREQYVMLAKLYQAGGVLYGLLLLWIVPQNAFSADVATAFSLLVYTLLGLALYIKGRIHDEKEKTIFGTTLLVFVIAHLLLVDIAGMNSVGRIFTFGIIGVLLMSTAFLGKKR